MGMTMEEGVVSEWLVDEGAEITKGQEILEFETDKIIQAPRILANIEQLPCRPLGNRPVERGSYSRLIVMFNHEAEGGTGNARDQKFVVLPAW